MFQSRVGNLCVDVTGNTVNNDMAFVDFASGDLQVEDFANIETINTFLNMATTQEFGGGATPVADGACAIP